MIEKLKTRSLESFCRSRPSPLAPKPALGLVEQNYKVYGQIYNYAVLVPHGLQPQPVRLVIGEHCFVAAQPRTCRELYIFLTRVCLVYKNTIHSYTIYSFTNWKMR